MKKLRLNIDGQTQKTHKHKKRSFSSKPPALQRNITMEHHFFFFERHNLTDSNLFDILRIFVHPVDHTFTTVPGRNKNSQESFTVFGSLRLHITNSLSIQCYNYKCFDEDNDVAKNTITYWKIFAAKFIHDHKIRKPPSSGFRHKIFRRFQEALRKNRKTRSTPDSRHSATCRASGRSPP